MNQEQRQRLLEIQESLNKYLGSELDAGYRSLINLTKLVDLLVEVNEEKPVKVEDHPIYKEFEKRFGPPRRIS